MAGGHAEHVMRKLVNSRNDRQQTPLMLAASHGHLAIVNILLDMGADVWAVDNLGGRCAMHYAARANHADVVLALLDVEDRVPRPAGLPGQAGSSLADVRTQYGFTPLHFAVRGHGMEAAAVLLRRGACVSAASIFDGEWLDCPRGTTPLHLAARLAQHDMAMLLLQEHADNRAADGAVDPRLFKDVDELLPCHVAAIRHHTDLAELLCPSTSLANALSGMALHTMLGPPRLARLAAAALHNKLGAALQVCQKQQQQEEEAAVEHALLQRGSATMAADAGASCAVSSSSTCTSGEPGRFRSITGCSRGESCPVCLEPPGWTAIVVQPCGHQLCHSCCVGIWEMHAAEKMTCPLCRAAVANVVPAAGAGNS